VQYSYVFLSWTDQNQIGKKNPVVFFFKRSDVPVDVSLTLRVNVTGDCPSQWHDDLLGGGKSMETPPQGKKKTKRNITY
jgi:hypothetical protein